jgi:hypothetical protein
MDPTYSLEEVHGATRDRFLIGLLLAENLWHNNIILCATMTRNRNKIPHELLPKKRKEAESSIFAFHDEVTLAAYVPKKNTLATKHHNSKNINGVLSPNSKSFFIKIPHKKVLTPLIKW